MLTVADDCSLKPLPVGVSNILKQRKDQLVKLLPAWQNAEQSGIFAENFFPDRSVSHRRKELDALLAKVGTITGSTEMVAENQLRGAFMLKCTSGNIRVFFTLSPENPALIQWLDFSVEK